MKNVKTNVANKILRNVAIIYVLLTALLLCGGIVLIVLGATHIETVKEGYYTEYVKKPDIPMIVIGCCMIALTPILWLGKPFLDGYGLIVYDAAVRLEEKNIKTRLDIKAEEWEKVRAQNSETTSNS